MSAIALSLGLAASPVAAKPPPYERAEGQKWFDWAGERANQAQTFKDQGLHGKAEEAREEVLHGLVLAWREESDPRALDPIVKTLHQRLGRSTSAVRVALRFAYELQATDLEPGQQAQLERLQDRISMALLRLRREAVEGDATLCRGPVGLRLGELALEGPLPTDPILVLRDVDGGLQAVTCPVLDGPAVAEPGNGPWWLLGSGLAVAAVGGAFLALGAREQTEADRLQGLFDDDEGTAQDGLERWKSSGRAEAYGTAGVITASVGGVIALGGLIWGLARDDGGPTAGQARLAPAPGGMVLFGRF